MFGYHTNCAVMIVMHSQFLFSSHLHSSSHKQMWMNQHASQIDSFHVNLGSMSIYTCGSQIFTGYVISINGFHSCCLYNLYTTQKL